LIFLFVGDNNNCNITNLGKVILFGGYNQLIKCYQSTKKVYDKFFRWGTHTNNILVWGYNKEKA